MICKVRVEVRLKPGFHDPEGMTVKSCLQDLGIKSVVNVESGRIYYLYIDCSAPEEARKIAEIACEKLLANPVKDTYTIDVLECRES